MSRLLPAVLAIALALGGVGAASAHPYSVTTSQLDWNADAGLFEVALRLLPEQLEDVLRGRKVAPADRAAVDAALADWLRENVALKTPSGELAALRWVGKEIEADAAWLYFELVLPVGAAPEGLELRNTLLFESAPHQLNTVRVRVGERQRAWLLRADRPVVVLTLAPGGPATADDRLPE